MAQSAPDLSDERILDTMIQLARVSKSQRIFVAGSKGLVVYLGLLQRGFSRTGTPATSRIPCGQYDVALISGHQSIQSLEKLVSDTVPFLGTRAALAISMEYQERGRDQKLQIALEQFGFLIEAHTPCERGFVLSARRHACDHVANAA